MGTLCKNGLSQYHFTTYVHAGMADSKLPRRGLTMLQSLTSPLSFRDAGQSIANLVAACVHTFCRSISQGWGSVKAVLPPQKELLACDTLISVITEEIQLYVIAHLCLCTRPLS